MLYLIGLGIWDEKDLSLKGLDACRRADEVFAEFYTAKWGGSRKGLESVIGKRFTLLERKHMEEESGRLIQKAKSRNIAILVPGDPLSATTHLKLLQEARESGIPFRVIHSSSILTSVAESGLSIYNFGRVVTMVTPTQNYSPETFYDTLLQNSKAGLHSLILLDIKMGVRECIDILIGKENERKGGLLSPETRMVAMSRLGSEEQRISYDTPLQLKNENMSAPAVLIIPGSLQFFEQEFLERL
jgi:diphthine synthase